MLNIKKVGKSGGITIPLGLRRDLNILPGDSLEVEADHAGQIIVKRHVSHCIFCGNTHDVDLFKGKPVCDGCKSDLNREA